MREKRFIHAVAFFGILLALAGLQACPCGRGFQLEIAVAPEETGTVLTVPEDTYHDAGTVVALTASPAAGWRFDHWEGPVADTALPVTSLAIQTKTKLTAVFTESAPPAETAATIALDDEGAILETATLAIAGGSSLELPAGTRISAPETGPPEGSPEAILADTEVAALEPVAFTNWVWSFEVAVDDGARDGAIVFSSLSDTTAVDPDYAAQGLLVRVPLGTFGIETGAEAVLYRLAETGAKEDPPAWERVARNAVDENGVAQFPLYSVGRFAIGVRSYAQSAAPDLGMSPLYDCVLRTATAMNRVKVIEDSTAEVFNAWLFTDILPDQMPETTEWEVRGIGDEPCMARLEEYGCVFRLRSPYANAFSAEFGLQNEKQERALMSGPFEVDANGQPAGTPLGEPYLQCDRIFGCEVDVAVLSRDGDWTSFNDEVVLPLRAEYDSGENIASNVTIRWFKNLTEGYYAKLSVHTEECTQNVANATTILDEEGVVIATLKGRFVYIMDWRGGVYLAVEGVIANQTAVGLRFYDPFWNLEGGILDEHVLGGPNHMLLGLIDMEYDWIHDTLWTIQKDENNDFNLFRYDKPAYNYGDRAPDARIDIPTLGWRQIYLDPATDRLYLHEFSSDTGKEFLIYQNASTAPSLENSINYSTSSSPENGEPRFMADFVAPRNNTLYMLSQYGNITQEGLAVATYNLNASSHEAHFQAWATFGGENSAPIIPGVYSLHNDILYAGTSIEWNGYSAILAINTVSTWQSVWIVDPESGNGFWTPDQPSYRTITWPNAGDIRDIDIVEGTPELLAVAQAPAGQLNHTQIYLFSNTNQVSGTLQPIYSLDLDYGTSLVTFINPPAPQPEP